TNLEPGQYEVAATKNGFHKSSARVEVAARRTARVDLPLENVIDFPRRFEKASSAPLTEREKLLLGRLDQLEARLAAMEASKPRTNIPTPGGEQLVASVTPIAAQSSTIAGTDAPAQIGGKSALPQRPTAISPQEHQIPDALQAPPTTPGVDNFTPFAYGDFT